VTTVELKQRLASVWTDPNVARLYRFRPDYPARAFAIVERLLVAPRTILDVGCGNGALTRGLTAFASRIDAVDPSAAMLAEARSLPGGTSERIRWINGPAETAPLDPPYALVTCGSSLHWMDHDVVMPRFADALAPGGRLVVLDVDWDFAPGWRADLRALINRFSPETKGFAADLLGDLVRRGLFQRHGFERTASFAVDQSIDDFVAMLQSTSSLSSVMQRERTDGFARETRALFGRLGLDRARYAASATAVWGRPLRP
jgi:SAM-dependent methyltransferase